MASGKINISPHRELIQATSTSLVTAGQLIWLVKKGGIVTGTGSVFQVGTLSTQSNVIGTLPSGYRPINDVYAFMVGEYGGEIHPVKFSADGNITALNPRNGGSITSDWYSISAIAWVAAID